MVRPRSARAPKRTNGATYKTTENNRFRERRRIAPVEPGGMPSAPSSSCGIRYSGRTPRTNRRRRPWSLRKSRGLPWLPISEQGDNDTIVMLHGGCFTVAAGRGQGIQRRVLDRSHGEALWWRVSIAVARSYRLAKIKEGRGDAPIWIKHTITPQGCLLHPKKAENAGNSWILISKFQRICVRNPVGPIINEIERRATEANQRPCWVLKQ